MIKYLLVLGYISIVLSLQCTKPQRAGWFTFDALSARDHVTQVFQDLNKNITEADAYTTTLNGTKYTIDNFKGQAYYNDHFQKDLYVNDNVVNVTGGQLLIEVHFKYSFNGTEGRAEGHALAEDSWFTKKLERVDGFITWDAQTINIIELKNNIIISNSEPKLSDNAKIAYQNIINNHAQEQNRLKQNLMNEINSLYHTKLAFSLHNQDLVKINNVTYTYKNTTAEYTNAVMDVKLNNIDFKGLQYTFLFELDNYTKECNDLPTKYNATYGGVQEIYAFSWVKATLAYFADKGVLDAQLNNKWDIEMFQFYAGDLQNAIPNIQKFAPNTPITGTVKYNKEKSDDLVVAAQSTSSIRVQIPYVLNIYVNQTTRIQTATFIAVFEQKWSLSGQNLVTKIIYSGVAGAKFEEEGEYPIQNVALATQYIKKILENLENKVSIGNNFKVVKRNRGGVVIQKDYIIMYDPSQK